MTAILIAFFALVIAVNILMATIAVRSFGGTVVENSYVASQKFNGWLAQARAQEKMGWKAEVTRDEQRHVRLALKQRGGPITSTTITAVAQHPLGLAADIALTFHQIAPGRYASDRPLPAGRWQVRFVVRHANGEQRLLREID